MCEREGESERERERDSFYRLICRQDDHYYSERCGVLWCTVPKEFVTQSFPLCDTDTDASHSHIFSLLGFAVHHVWCGFSHRFPTVVGDSVVGVAGCMLLVWLF